MRTFEFAPAIGQRYTRFQQGLADSVWTISSISRPISVADSTSVTFTEEVAGTWVRRTLPHCADEIMTGLWLPASARPTVAVTPVVALNDLIAGMSEAGLLQFTTRSAYVLMLQRSSVGTSHKSSEFGLAISAFYQLRLQEWRKLASDNPGTELPAMETHAPAPTSVYRWFLAYRKAGNDLRVLAQSELAVRKRKPRKPQEREVLQAFLEARTAVIGTHSVISLTDEFNQLLASTSPLHLNQLIEKLRTQARATAAQNKKTKATPSSMKAKWKKTPKPSQKVDAIDARVHR